MNQYCDLLRYDKNFLMWDSKREFLSILIYGMKSEKKNFHQNFFFHVPPHMDWKLSWRFFKIFKKKFFFLCLFHISKWTWITLQNITLKSFWHIPFSHSIGLKLLHFVGAGCLNQYCDLFSLFHQFFGLDSLEIYGLLCIKELIIFCYKV